MGSMLSNLTASQIIILLLSFLVSMSLHEAMHAFAAHALGDATAQEEGRLTLNPLAHIDLVTTILLPLAFILVGQPPFFAAKPVPFRPDRVKYDEWGAALVGLAGPFTNLALAIIGAFVFHNLPATASNLIYNVVLIFVEVNVGFFIFNLIPFPPLDGSRLLYAVAPEPIQEVMYRIEQYGFFAILIFVVVLYPVISPAIGGIEQSLIRLLLG